MLKLKVSSPTIRDCNFEGSSLERDTGTIIFIVQSLDTDIGALKTSETSED